jgi:hypothetical protein
MGLPFIFKITLKGFGETTNERSGGVNENEKEFFSFI